MVVRISMLDHKEAAAPGLSGRRVPVAPVAAVVGLLFSFPPPLPAVFSLPPPLFGVSVAVGPSLSAPLRVLPVREARLVADAGVEKLSVLETELK